jgi:DNA mismatch repair protein MutL
MTPAVSRPVVETVEERPIKPEPEKKSPVVMQRLSSDLEGLVEEAPPVQTAMAMPQVEQPKMPETILEKQDTAPYRIIGQALNTYIIVEEGDGLLLIDKHAAHERILFEKLKANQEAISSQILLTPVPVTLNADAVGELLANTQLLAELGFEIDEFGDHTILARQIPMDLSPENAAEALESLAADLLAGRREEKTKVRDEMLHTVACKAAIKAGWTTSEPELLALVKQVMVREDLKYCPHGRPICVSLSKKQLEKQFKRS